MCFCAPYTTKHNDTGNGKFEFANHRMQLSIKSLLKNTHSFVEVRLKKGDINSRISSALC